jgi:type IV secretion system protein TrbC
MMLRRVAMALLIMGLTFLPDLALAATAGGGGMPYSTGLNTFRTSVTGEIAGIICLIGVIGAVIAYLLQGMLDGLMMSIVRVIIGACIIGGAATFLTTIGVTGAIV